MTQQFDLMPAELVDESVLERIGAQLPKAREVKPRLLREMFHDEQSDAPATASRDHDGEHSDA